MASPPNATERPIPAGSVAAILPAAGRSSRFAGKDKKIFSTLSGKPVWQHAVERMRGRAEIGPIVISIAASDQERWDSEYSDLIARFQLTLVLGGEERSDSVLAALEIVEHATLVAVHDAARPLVSDEDVASVIQQAHQCGAAILASPVRGTLKRELQTPVGCQTVDRRDLWEAMTPQVFRTDVLRQAYDRWRGRPITDDAQIVELAGHTVHLVLGSTENIKITRPEDLRIAEAILASMKDSGVL